MPYDLLLRKNRPLIDPRAGVDIPPQELSCAGTAVREEAADGEALGEGESRCCFKGGAFAEGEFGEEGGGLVCNSVGVSWGFEEGEVGEGGDCFGLVVEGVSLGAWWKRGKEERAKGGRGHPFNAEVVGVGVDCCEGCHFEGQVPLRVEENAEMRLRGGFVFI
jgi:hypothetical protein